MRSHEWNLDPTKGRTIDFRGTRFSSPDFVCRQTDYKCVPNSFYCVNVSLLLKTTKLWEDSVFWLELLLVTTLLGDFHCCLSDGSSSAAFLGNEALLISGDGCPSKVEIKLQEFSVFCIGQGLSLLYIINKNFAIDCKGTLPQKNKFSRQITTRGKWVMFSH